MKKPEFIKDKEGVSPVIGVILMVAITVIMAAIVAGFVFGVISTPESTPQASLTVDGWDNGGNVTFLHQSGDSLNMTDLRVTIGGEDIGGLGNWSSSSLWNPGTTRTFNANTSLSSGDTVRIIHTPSGNSISQGTLSQGNK